MKKLLVIAFLLTAACGTDDASLTSTEVQIQECWTQCKEIAPCRCTVYIAVPPGSVPDHRDHR